MLGDKLIKDVFIIDEKVIEGLPEGVRLCYNRGHSAYADTRTMTNYYILPKRLTRWVKFLGLFSHKLMVDDLVHDLYRVINEEVLHQVISKVEPGTTASGDHAVLAELRKIDYDQFPYCDIAFSDEARNNFYKKRA